MWVYCLFFVWMLHGSTKVVVRAVALLSAKPKWKVANTLERFFHESNKFEKHNETKPPTTLQSPGECRGGWVKPVPRAVRSRASWQRREHACQPSEGEGNACSIGWKRLQILKRIKFWLFATSMLSRLNLVKSGFEHMWLWTKRSCLEVCEGETVVIFFVWMLHGSTLPLSGRSPFCQLQMVKMSQQTLDENSTEATTSSKINKTNTKQSPRECEGRVKVACSSDG